MAGVDALGAVEGELPALAAVPNGVWVEEEPDVVAERQSLAYAPYEPVLAATQDRQAMWTRVPFAPGELVDVVARLSAEALCEVVGVSRDEMDRKVVGVLR